MADGYKNAGEHDFADLDEWLCEYVDGTIDPAVCKALEEYMQLNPELATHVEQLCETRHLLCQYGCSYQAPSGLQPRLRRRLASEIIQESQPLLGTSTAHLMALATFTSLFAFILIFAATSYSTSKDALPISAELSTTKEQQPLDQLLRTQNRRATPITPPTPNNYYGRFTRQPAVFRYSYLSPGLFPLNPDAQPATIQFAPLEQEFYTAP